MNTIQEQVDSLRKMNIKHFRLDMLSTDQSKSELIHSLMKLDGLKLNWELKCEKCRNTLKVFKSEKEVGEKYDCNKCEHELIATIKDYEPLFVFIKKEGSQKMINQAIEFASQCHSMQTRKDSNIPYILHCMEAGVIAAELTKGVGTVDEEVVAAAILHDTIEDAYATPEMIENLFGKFVVELVNAQTEDKSKSWKERKEDTINFLHINESIEVEITTLADKLSNIRSIASDQKLMGEKVWSKFNSTKEQQHWYYMSIALAFKQIKDTKEYKEYLHLIQEIFE